MAARARAQGRDLPDEGLLAEQGAGAEWAGAMQARSGEPEGAQEGSGLCGELGKGLWEGARLLLDAWTSGRELGRSATAADVRWGDQVGAWIGDGGCVYAACCVNERRERGMRQVRTSRRRFLSTSIGLCVGAGVSGASPLKVSQRLQIGGGTSSSHGLSVDDMIVQLNALQVRSIELPRVEFLLVNQ